MTISTVILIVLAAIVLSSSITSFVTSKKMRAKVAYKLDHVKTGISVVEKNDRVAY